MLNTYHKGKKTDKELAHEKSLAEKELWHRLVVKVITWKDGTVGKGVVQAAGKITHQEWKTYRARITKVNGSVGKDRMTARLKETQQKIAQNGGFA